MADLVSNIELITIYFCISVIVSCNVVCLFNSSYLLEIKLFWTRATLLGGNFSVFDHFLISVQTKPANFRQRLSAADEAGI